MRITLTPTQSEIMHLLYTNINNANTYCETLLSDKELFKGIKEETVRPAYIKINFLKKAFELKMPTDRREDRFNKFDDTLSYDEVVRLMAYMTPEDRAEVERFCKTLISEPI